MNDTAENNLIRIENLTKIYSGAGEKLTVFSDVNVNLKRGSKTVILGESGSGKSTLLNIIGALDNASGGKVQVGPYEVTSLDEENAALYRADFLGLIFQFHYLLKDFYILSLAFY